ncbi:4Fe-4S dicluster domain-containing protein [Desulfolithobacter sp.]
MANKTQTDTGSACKKKTARKTGKTRERYDVAFYLAWCKACGICIAFCPQKIIAADKNGKPYMTDSDRCVGCRFCEIHCPDFAITVSTRTPKRRKNDA